MGLGDFLRQHGRRAVAVHSGETSAPRAQSLDELSEGRLDVICAVDVFNEGLDLPELDTVLMLRPTESRILWLQQFGRGLRKEKDDKPLTVIDHIGNHRTFLLKPQTLFSLPAGGPEILNLLERAGRADRDRARLLRHLRVRGDRHPARPRPRHDGPARGPQALLRGVRRAPDDGKYGWQTVQLSARLEF